MSVSKASLVEVANEEGHLVPVQSYTLSLNGFTVEVCEIGASVTRFLVPPSQDDIVLGYKSPLDMWKCKNPPYFCSIVGRVANRIACGKLSLPDGSIHDLETNNAPHHLHGGSVGFSHRIWASEVVQLGNDRDGVKFTFHSSHGDQGYPGSIRVEAIYSLRKSRASTSVTLCLEMRCTLTDDRDVQTPANLAQHSYFNLGGHDNENGILDHFLTIPASWYTSTDSTSIPTRQVEPLNHDEVMDWRTRKNIRVALLDYGVQKMGLRKETVTSNLDLRQTQDAKPYGFDHNYVLNRSHSSDLHVAGILEHPATKRRLVVRTNAPGVQLYTGNYLDGSLASASKSTAYRWQGVCLETQHFPDAISVDSSKHPDFAVGQCVILSKQNPVYRHKVEYEVSTGMFCGVDTCGNTFDSVQDVWESQLDWYERAADYYEENCPASIDGVLGGFASISDIDLEGSRRFLTELASSMPSLQWSSGAACECGAGIGRVSKGLLLPLGVSRCDLVESSSRLLSAAPEYLGPLASQCRYFCAGLQDWEPKKGMYSIIWIQWVLCYLRDDDAVTFLERCSDALVDGGVICLKENICVDEDFVVDVDDASVTRSVEYLKHLATRACLNVVLERFQDDFPNEIFPVPMIALAPIEK